MSDGKILRLLASRLRLCTDLNRGGKVDPVGAGHCAQLILNMFLDLDACPGTQR